MWMDVQIIINIEQTSGHDFLGLCNNATLFIKKNQLQIHLNYNKDISNPFVYPIRSFKQRERGQWAVYNTSPQSFIIMFIYSLA